MRSVNWSSPVNWNHPLNKGLVHWWLNVPHWQGGTVWRDLTDRQHGTLTNMVPADDWVGPQGRLGGYGALDFDGDGDYVAITGASAGANNRTISHWGRFVDNNSVAYIMDSGTGRFIIAYDENAITNEMQFFDGSWKAFGATVFDVWQYYVWTFNSVVNEAKLFIDGVKFGSTLTYASVSIGGSTNIMARNTPSAGTYGTGLLDDFRMYDRTLSPAEVVELTRLSRTFYPGLLNRRGRRVVVAAEVGIANPWYQYTQQMVGVA